MKSGWFKMYRSIVDWEWFKEHDMTCFFIYCLCNANLRDRVWRGTPVRRGQLVVSRSTVCRELGIKERRYRTILSRLEKSGEIEVDTSNTNTIITIVNWERYQEDFMEESAEMRPDVGQEPSIERPRNNSKDESSNICIPSEKIPLEAAASKVETYQVEEVDGEPRLFFEEDDEPKQPPHPKKKKDEVDCDFVLRLYHDRCPALPRVVKLTDKRKTRIRLLLEDMKFSYETLQQVFDKAQESRFMRGDNNRGWKADFDWIISNKNNWVKILEGKYDNHEKTVSQIMIPTNATINTPVQRTGFVSQADRNAAESTRQKCDILNTLAECQQEFDSGNI